MPGFDLFVLIDVWDAAFEILPLCSRAILVLNTGSSQLVSRNILVSRKLFWKRALLQPLPDCMVISKWWDGGLDFPPESEPSLAAKTLMVLQSVQFYSHPTTISDVEPYFCGKVHWEFLVRGGGSWAAGGGGRPVVPSRAAAGGQERGPLCGFWGHAPLSAPLGSRHELGLCGQSVCLTSDINSQKPKSNAE